MWLILKENTFCVCTDNIYILSKSRILDKNTSEKKSKVLFQSIEIFTCIVYTRYGQKVFPRCKKNMNMQLKATKICTSNYLNILIRSKKLNAKKRSLNDAVKNFKFLTASLGRR